MHIAAWEELITGTESQPVGTRVDLAVQKELITGTKSSNGEQGLYAALEDFITGTECHQWGLKCIVW